MTRLPLLVGACLLIAAVGGALAGIVPANAPPASGASVSHAPGDADARPDDAGTSASERPDTPASERPGTAASAAAPGESVAPPGESVAPLGERAALPDERVMLPDERALVVTDAETGERLLAVPVAEGTTVALNYTHSVEKTPVLDVYEVNGTELEMVRMEFRSYGAGLPARAEVTVTENGTFVFDPEGSYDHLYVTPGRVAGHELRVGDLTYDLVELSDARTVKLSVGRWSAATNASDTYRN